MRYVARGVFVASAMGLSAVVLCPAGAQAQVSTAYTYDALGRLKTVTNAGGATVTYAYDAADNRSQVVVAGVQTAPSAFDLGAPVTGAAAGAWVLSASPVLSGFTGAAAISVTGGEYRIDGGSWQTAAATVSAGQSVQVRVQAPTTAGASQTATLNVGGVTAAFQVTTATADTTPDAISPADHSLTADVDESFTAGSSFTVSGITAPITLRFGSSLISTSGNVSSRQMIVVRTTAAGVREEWFVAAPAGTLDVTANNGDQFTIKGFLATSSGRASTSWRWTVSNQTAGGAQLGTATVTQTVDNDNNFKVD
jgi:YD repeat-containing protein